MGDLEATRPGDGDPPAMPSTRYRRAGHWRPYLLLLVFFLAVSVYVVGMVWLALRLLA